MPDKLQSPEKQQPIELTTDFLGEDRHEFVAKLAYKLWEDRGRPFGSPEVDWFAAEILTAWRSASTAPLKTIRTST